MGTHAPACELVLGNLSLQQSGLLLSVGSEEPGVSSSTLKVWDASRLVTAGAGSTAPQPLLTVKVSEQSQEESHGEVRGTGASEVTCASVCGQSAHVLRACFLAGGWACMSSRTALCRCAGPESACNI